MKKIFAVLSIVFLLTASVAGYAEYCVYAYKACAVTAGSEAQCPHKVESSPAVERGGCAANDRCGAVRSCKNSVSDEAVQKCADKEDCKPKICRARLPLIADRPNRIVSPTPDLFACGTVNFQLDLYALTYKPVPLSHPPRGIHPGIATTILRI